MFPATRFLRFRACLLFGSLLILPTILFAQASEFFRAGTNNAGKEFYLAFPANWEFPATNKFLRLYITSDVKTDVDIYVLGQFKGSVQTVPSEVITFDITNLEGQLFVRDENSPVPDDTVYPGQAVRIVADDPIIVTGMNRTDFTSDGLLVLPVHALGREYIVASAASVAGDVQELPSQYMIVAPHDNTSVTIVNPGDTPNHSADVPFSIVLNRGDVFSAMSVGFSGDLSGARITADKPVAVIAGQNCTYLPSFEYPACDHLVEMMLPVEAWGNEYYSLPFAERTKGDMYRIFAAEPETDVYVNGAKLATLNSEGSNSVADWFEFRQEKREPLTFIGSKPIFVVQYNNSQSYDNSTSTDPFYTVLTPAEQFQTDLIFSTPGADFPKNFINLVCDSAGMSEIEITEAGKDEWEKLHVQFSGSLQSFYTQTGGKNYVGKSFPIPPGTYQLRGPQPFAGYIYGGGQFDSYGYPIAVSTGIASSVKSHDSQDLALRIVGNPAVNGQILVECSLPGRMDGTLTLTDVRGRNYYNAVFEGEEAGTRVLRMNVLGIPSGIYFCTLAADGVKITRRVMIFR